MNTKPPLDQRFQLERLIVEGRKIEAIKLYREATGSALKESKEQVEAYTEELRRSSPQRFAASPRRSAEPVRNRILLFVIAIAALAYVGQSGRLDGLLERFGAWLEPPAAPPTEPSAARVTSPAVVIAPPPMPAAAREPQPAVGRILREPQAVRGVWIDDDLHAQPEAGEIETLYARKLANPDYLAWKNRPGIPRDVQHFPEEAAIKAARSRLAAKIRPPAGITPYPIPLNREQPPPTIDGYLSPGEWDYALEIPIGVAGADTRLLLRADQGNLYLAADAPRDRTASGYDQLRFYLHVGTAPALANERLHVSPGGADNTRAIRETHVLWTGSPATSEDERWKNYPISDWNIYARAAGASRMTDHRQYEALLDLEESGLHVGVAFPAYVEVETDPLRGADGKFQGRQELGMLGSQKQPHWFVITPGD